MGCPASVLEAWRCCAVCERAEAYIPRQPEKSVLHETVAGHLETFLARQRERDRPVPRFVERELRKFLECGVAAHGFLRVHCDACGMDRVVPYSCKCRGFCPSCCGRRMADTAAHLADRVFPEEPVRQWVLSVPYPLRYRLAYDAPLVTAVARIFQRAVFASIRRRAGMRSLNRRARSGAVVFIQRFSDALNLDPHFHLLALDGLYVESGNDPPVFRRVSAPDDREVKRVALRVRRAVERLLKDRGLDSEADAYGVDRLWDEQPLLAELYSASVSGRVATGPRAGRSVIRLGAQPGEGVEPVQASCAASGGFSVHAGVAVPAHDRERLERLARYAARPPVATGRLSRLGDGRLLYRLKRRWSDGTSHVVFHPLELLERLAALVPPPRYNIIRYYGVLAPRSAFRPMIVPRAKEESVSPPADRRDGVSAPGERQTSRQDENGVQGKKGRNYSWARLMARVFELDVLRCPRCGERMRIMAAIDSPEAIAKILACLGLPIRPPPLTPAEPDPESLSF
jgi:hypothetical protein